MKKILLAALMVLGLSALPVFNGCSSETGEGFAIYLTKDDVLVSQMEALSHVDIADEPIISIDDIVSYDWETHEIELTPTAFDRINVTPKDVFGNVFMVCVDKQPVYWGAFWSMLSSISFNGVTIIRPYASQAKGGYFIYITLGYPAPDFFTGEDPRSDPLIMESLEQAGKLK